MDIKQHFKLILDKYDLNYLYIKYIGLSILNSVVKEGFYWALLYLADSVKTQPEMLSYYAGFLICLYGLGIPVKKYFMGVKIDFMKQLRIANFKHFNEKIINIRKDTALNFDLIEYFTSLNYFNDYFEEFIISEQIKYDIPIRCITLLIIAFSKNFNILLGLFSVFYAVIAVMNEHKLIIESKLTQELYDVENQVRNYVINSKQFIVNDDFNRKYVDENIDKAESINNDIFCLNNHLDMKVNIILFSFILTVIYLKRKELSPTDFLYYFLVIYDIEFVADKVTEYYKYKLHYNKMQERLNFLNMIKVETPVEHMTAMYDTNNPIVITSIEHDMPKIGADKPIVIQPMDHILVQGESGSGKTSLLYVLKGMLQANQLTIYPDIKLINAHSYMILSNHKSIFSGMLYDIVTNYEENPNVELINTAIKLAHMEHKLGGSRGNEMINIDRLSGGERIRLIVTRLIYLIKRDDRHNLLLFDEIDDNLNDKLAVEIATNLLEIFNDKTILYITHNEKVKKLFKKKLMVKDGTITSNQ
jgi:ABC-type lipoprotein export system ATPase subunit